MKTAGAFLAGVATAVVLVVGASYAWLKSEALSARNKPGDREYDLANYAMGLSIPNKAKTAMNPLGPVAPGDLEGRRLYSDNCSVCHGIDGAGKTTTAKGLSPEVPDLHANHVQRLTDGELFYIVRNGVRFTAMPAWDFRDDQIWKLVGVVRSFKKPATSAQR